jgi:hypothetical protein
MTLRLSTGLRNFVNADGSIKGALQNGKIEIYTGSQPATADAAPTGTLLATITAASASRTAEVLATGSVTLAGSSGSVTALTVNSVSIIDAAVPFNTSLTQTAADLADMINNSRSAPDYTATSSGAAVTIIAARGTGASPNGFVVSPTLTTLTSTNVNMGSGVAGVTAVNGLKLGTSVAGVLSKHPTQVWSGIAGATGTAGWFRFSGSVADSGALDSAATEIRMDGAISTSGAQLNMSSTSITSAATQTISSFPITLPTS